MLSLEELGKSSTKNHQLPKNSSTQKSYLAVQRLSTLKSHFGEKMSGIIFSRTQTAIQMRRQGRVPEMLTRKSATTMKVLTASSKSPLLNL